MEPNQVKDLLRSAENIQDRDFEPFLQAKDHPLLCVTTSALPVAHADRHPPMAFANLETYEFGESAYDIKKHSGDGVELANVPQMRFGSYM